MQLRPSALLCPIWTHASSERALQKDLALVRRRTIQPLTTNHRQIMILLKIGEEKDLTGENMRRIRIILGLHGTFVSHC